MRCDGKNPNCDRRRELLSQLKCLISSMERKKPCEWDEPFCEPAVCCAAECPPLCPPPFCGPIKACKSFNFRASIMYRCDCVKRNGLQDRCMMWECMGRPECMTKLYPVCEPGRTTLLKLTDLGDAEVALRKFYCADQAREAALAAYCRLVCDPCCMPYDCLPCPPTGCPTPCKPVPCNDMSSYQICISPTYPDCCTPCDFPFPCNPSLFCPPTFCPPAFCPPAFCPPAFCPPTYCPPSTCLPPYPPVCLPSPC